MKLIPSHIGKTKSLLHARGGEQRDMVPQSLVSHSHDLMDTYIKLFCLLMWRIFFVL